MSKRHLEEEDTKEQEGSSRSQGLPFKNPSFQHSNVSGSRKKPWKTLKQLLAAEAALDWPEVGLVWTLGCANFPQKITKSNNQKKRAYYGVHFCYINLYL